MKEEITILLNRYLAGNYLVSNELKVELVKAILLKIEEHSKKECEHPFKRLHWINNLVFCNKCKRTLNK
jgi:hypothetical protein